MSEFKPMFPITSFPCRNYDWFEEKIKEKSEVDKMKQDRIMYFDCIHKAASYVEGLVGGGVGNVKIEHNLSMAVAGEWQVTWRL